MNFPKNLKYTNDHEWIRVDENQEGEAYVGVTDYAQSELGEIVFVDVSSEGETIEKDETFGSIEAVKTVSDLLMPVTGEVLEINGDLEDNPDLVNSDPYGKGWIIKIQISDASQLAELMSDDKYRDFVAQ